MFWMFWNAIKAGCVQTLPHKYQYHIKNSGYLNNKGSFLFYILSFYSHVPVTSEELGWSICIHFEDYLQSEDAEKEPFCFINAEPNEEGIYQDGKVKEIAEKPTRK